jgi:hypothetical protein
MFNGGNKLLQCRQDIARRVVCAGRVLQRFALGRAHGVGRDRTIQGHGHGFLSDRRADIFHEWGLQHADQLGIVLGQLRPGR